MINDICFGAYTRFTTESAKEGAALALSDNLIGDAYTIELEKNDKGDYTAWIVNKFGARVAFLEDEYLYKVQTLQARGWTIRAYLSFVAIDGDTQVYWGEVALLCNDPHYDQAFETFGKALRTKMAEGIRPNVDFTEQAARQIIESEGEWFPEGRVALPKLKKGSTMVKTRQSASDKLIEQGRAGNKGCYAITYVIYAVLAVLVVAGILKFVGVI